MTLDHRITHPRFSQGVGNRPAKAQTRTSVLGRKCSKTLSTAQMITLNSQTPKICKAQPQPIPNRDPFLEVEPSHNRKKSSSIAKKPLTSFNTLQRRFSAHSHLPSPRSRFPSFRVGFPNLHSCDKVNQLRRLAAMLHRTSLHGACAERTGPAVLVRSLLLMC